MIGGVLSVKVVSDPSLKGTICYTMKYIPGKMHMFCTINTYANLAKIFEGENYPVCRLFILLEKQPINYKT